MSVKFCVALGMFLTFFPCLLMNEELSFITGIILALGECLSYICDLHRFGKLDYWIFEFCGRAKDAPF